MGRKFNLAFFVAFTVLLVLGLGFLTASFFVFRSYFFTSDEYIETKAYIVEHDDFDVAYTIISYSPEGSEESIQVKVNYYSSTDRAGDEITIKYNVNDHNKVKLKNEILILSIVFAAVGVFQLIPAMIVGSIGITLKFKRKYFLTHGKKSTAKVVSLKPNYSLSFGNTHPQKIECKLNNGKTISSSLYSDKFYNTNDNLVVDVYKHDTKEKYYVDGNSIRMAETLNDELEVEDINDINNFNF